MDVVIYTDGACKGNPGKGGWGALLTGGEKPLEIFGGASRTTNNRMEITAVIEAFKRLTQKGLSVKIVTDSNYIVKGMTEWLPKWLRKDFKDVKNADLWKELVDLSSQHTVEWVWVKGHAGHPENERADELANIGALCPNGPQ